MAVFLVGGAVLAQQQPPSGEQQTQPGQSEHAQPGESPSRGISKEDATREMSKEVEPEDKQAIENQRQQTTPSTSGTEGTAADRTPPGETPTGVAGSAADPGTAEIVGAEVVSEEDQTEIGSVVDVVLDEQQQQAEFLVIDSEGQMAAVPYSQQLFAVSEDKVVIDEQRLRDAPKLEQGEWRGGSDAWKDESMNYWKP
ncbi:MAG: hypothetical protein DIU71_01040 [Proteobacteria bacterium]|nr:MAG: hypothetical protein DIU71_01040 [Pseudomonadota bacterium]